MNFAGWARFVGAVSTGSGWIGIIAMWLLAALIFTEIVARTFFEQSFVFTLEVSTWLMVTLVLMGAAWTLREEGHIRINLISQRLSLRNQSWLTMWLAIIGIVVSGYVAFYAFDQMTGYYILGTRGESIARLPLWWAWAPLFVGLVVLTLQFTGIVANIISSQKSTNRPGKGLSPLWFIGLVIILSIIIGFLAVWPGAQTMDSRLVLLVLVIIVFGPILESMWIFISLTTAGILAMTIFTPYPVGIMAAKLIFNFNAKFIITCLPLFIFMGELLLHSGISKNLYEGIASWVERIPGRLLHSNVLACTIFAAVSGSSAATTATIGTVALPELKRLGYSEGISLGSLAGAGTLGLLIPPSIIMIIYGSLVSESIGQLFLGGIIPGLILSGLFMLYIIAQAIRRPSIVPAARQYSWQVRFQGLIKMMPLIFVIGLVLGLIYLGVTTPTEAGAIGAVCAFLSVVLYRKLNWRVIKETSWGALKTTCMLMLIISTASLLASAVGYLRLPQYLAAAVADSGLSKYAILAIICVIYVALGCIIDGGSIMVLTLPIMYPLIMSLGFDGIWFGIVITILIETANVTPPVGFNLYVLQSISGQSIGTIWRHTFPFFILMLVALIIVILFPEVALTLPKMMIRGT